MRGGVSHEAGVGVNVSNREGWWVLDTRGYG
jgi:hypothetical protein